MPYSIAASIIAVFGACVVTVIVANTLPVEKSDEYMMGYHEADAKANELIKARIAFSKKYNIEYVTDALHVAGTKIKYRVVDKNNSPINNAKIKIIVTRPNNHKYDVELNNPKIENGIYSFESIKLPKEGRWNIIAKVNVGENGRFYNIKADTRAKEAFEY